MKVVSVLHEQIPVHIKPDNRNIRTRHKICLKLKIKKLKETVFITNF